MLRCNPAMSFEFRSDGSKAMTQNALVPRQSYQPPAPLGIRETLSKFAEEFGRVWFHRDFGLLVAWIVALAMAAIVVALPDRYSARAQVYVNTESLLRPLLKGLAIDPNLEEQVKVLQKTLLTDVNLSKVLVQIDDSIKPSDRADFANAVEDLRSQIKVDGVGNQLFSISYDGIEPERARQVVQSLLTIFIETNLGQSRTDMQTARDFVDQQILRYEEQLREADRKLSKFRLENSGVAGEQAMSTRIVEARKELDEATIELESAKSVRLVLESRLSKTQAVLGDDSAPAQIVVGDQMVVTAIDRINTLRAQLQGLKLRYTDDHPDVVSTQQSLNALIRQYSGGERQYAKNMTPPKTSDTAAVSVEPNAGVANLSAPTSIGSSPGVVGGVANPGVSQIAGQRNTTSPGQSGRAESPNPEYGEIQVQLVKAKLSILESEQKVARARATLETLRAGALLAPDVEAEYSELTRGYDVMRKNYQELLSRKESARMSQDVDTSVDVVQFRVVEPPVLPAKPSGPNRPMFLIIGTLLALAAGGAGAFVRGVFHDAVVSAQDLHGSFGLPVIATIGPLPGVFGSVRMSIQWVSLVVSVMGIVAAMTMIGFLSPYIGPLRLSFYQMINSALHLWS